MGAVVALAALLRLRGLGANGLRIDEIYIVSRSDGPISTLVSHVRETVMGAPVEFLLRHAVLSFTSREFFLRLPDAVFGTATVYLLYRLAARMFDAPTGVLAALLLAVSRLHVFQSQDARYYALFGLLSVASTLQLLGARERGGWRPWAAYALAMTLGFYTCYFMAFVALVHTLYVLGPLAPPGGEVRSRRAFILSGLATALAFAPWAIQYRPNPNIPYPGFEPVVALRTWTAEFANGRGVVEAVAFAFYAAGIAYAWRARRPAAVLCVFFVLLPAPIVLGLDIHFRYFFAARQLIFALPFFLAAVAYGIVRATRDLSVLAGRPVTQAAAAVALLILASAGLSEPPPQTGNPAAAREGWREAASFLLDHVEPGDFIVMTRLPFGPPDGDNIGYYLRTLDDRRRKFRIVNPAMLGSEGLTWLAAYGRVWCVIASRPFYEARPELLRQIDSGFTKECSFAGGALFPEIAIYRSGK